VWAGGRIFSGLKGSAGYVDRGWGNHPHLKLKKFPFETIYY